MFPNLSISSVKVPIFEWSTTKMKRLTKSVVLAKKDSACSPKVLASYTKPSVNEIRCFTKKTKFTYVFQFDEYF